MRTKRNQTTSLLAADDAFLVVVLLFAVFGMGVVVGQLFFG